MQKLHFVCKQHPDCYPFLGESYLYNHADYLALKTARFGTPLTFYALRGEVAVARIHFFLQSGPDGKTEAVSLPESPFGSLEFGDVTYNEMRAFVDFFTNELALVNVEQVNIRDCIAAYRTLKNISIEKLLLDAGYHKKNSCVNHHIVIDDVHLRNKMHRMEQKRLRKCKRANFYFQQESKEELKGLYHFLKNCRQQKGWKLSLSLSELKQQQKLSPDIFSLFSVFHNDKRIAAALCVNVNRRILYDFYHDSLAAYKNYSPVTMLLDGIYYHCRQVNIRLLDMGTSPVESLQNFKKHCGGTPSYKDVYSKVLR